MLLMGEERNDGVSVIPIVGMGGIGKTTLAQLVYNDRNVKQNFHKRAWICVSEEFDVISITRTLYESITGEPAQSKGLDMLQVRLKEELGKSKFLIVLDDVWNDNYGKWDDLRRPFQFGTPGSRIIVTTRNESVASVVGSPRTAYHMKLLTDEDCLSLLSLHSGSFHENSEWKEEVGLELVKKCKGLPLAAKTLGGLLRSKETKEEWYDVLNSKVWDLKEENILPVLRLSYHHLPSHLKHLFAYCSIFPKDYDFKKNELVYLWMGEGFLEKPNESKSKEELGLDYFNELLYRSFFQRSSESDEYFVMHDLINDLAQFVAGGTYYRLDEKMDTNQEYKIPEKARHGSFLRHEYEVFRKFKAFNQVKGLRTFLPMPVENSLVWPPFYLSNKILAELVPELHSLRVLSLSGYSITELPSSICNLLHLRYLNLSGTSIITLPDTLGDIYNLQTLSLHKCRSICKLPSTLGKLSNLRHLDNSDTDQLKDMPIEIGQLSNLQTLPKIVLSKAGGLGLRELRGLKHLRGSLSILELQNVTNIEDVKDARLFTHKLDELQLTWGSDVDQTCDRSAAEEVMDLLRPCDENLRSLKIASYGGFSFPSWIGLPSFRNLSSISILSCLECKSLPSLGQLPELKHLLIGSMQKLKCISTEFYGSGVMVPFPKLETLRFDHMPEWEEWAAFADGKDIKFPHLHQLTMSKCSKLTRVSPLNFPALRELDLEECNKVLLESFSDLDSLNSLKVEAITGLSYLPRELTLSLSALEVLECCSCSELLSLWPNETPLEHLTHLKRLVIADCKHLVSLGQGEQQFPSELEVLEVFRCANLITLPNDLSDLSSLRELIIKNCLKFISFPESGLPAMLKRLEILSCNALESLPSNMSDLERLEIKECSSLKTFARDGFPVSLKKLAIKNCTQLEPVSEMMFPQNSSMMLEDLSLCTWPNFSDLLQRLHGFSHIAELYLSSCYGLRHFPEQGLPPSLRALSIEDCANLKSLPAKIRSMTSLVSLELRSCPRLDNFPKWDLPPNLSSLRIWDSKKFKPLAKWGLHRLTSLSEFSICGGFRELEVLGHGNDLFPPSLIRFSIARFPKLTSLFEVLEKLTSLRHLSIKNCANLNDLPSEGLLEKLWNLEISDCPLLKPKCMRDKGEYWPKISGIPCVEIDGTYIYKQSYLSRAEKLEFHRQVDEGTHVEDAEFSSEQQGTKPTSSNAKRSKHHGESQVVDEATPVADAEFFGEQQGTEPTSSKVERSKHHRQVQVVDEATHVADVEFSSEQQGTEPTSSKAERSKYHVEIQVVDEATPVADAEFSGEHQGTEHTSSEAERSKHHREIQVVDEATLVADAEFSGEQQGTEPTSSEAERSKHHREIQVVDEATLEADAEFSGEQQGTEPTLSEAERSKHHKEIQVVDEATPVADAEFSREQQGTKPTSSKAEKSKHHQEYSPAACSFEEKGHYRILLNNNHLQLELDNQILSIRDYSSPSPPHSFPVIDMLNFVQKDLRESPEKSKCSNSLLLFLQRNKRLTVIDPSFFDIMPDLHFLDISDTKIRTLPSSLFKLSKLKVLMLRNCVCLENLPPEIGNLDNMEALDLSGTELYNLPNEIGKLTLLRSLQLSLYGPDDESEYDHLPTQLVSPSFLSELKEIRSLSISVHPEDYRWTKIVSCILKDISKLEMLSYLQFYSPEVEAFEDFIRTSPSWENKEMSKFDFIVGQNVKRVVSRVPDEVESLFNKQERCLRYVNGDKASPLIKTVLNRATAFYLDHHTEVQSLSEFNNSSLQALRFCVVRECPKIEAILDGKNAGSEFPCLEHLEIYFLWELKHIWKLPSPTGRLKRLFKTPTSSGNSAALRSLIISTCPKLQFVFWESMLQSLINLKELVVEDCECMERIIKEENKKVKYEDNVLPGLTRLVLHYLPMLVSVGNGVRLSEENITIHGCPKLIRQSQP